MALAVSLETHWQAHWQATSRLSASGFNFVLVVVLRLRLQLRVRVDRDSNVVKFQTVTTSLGFWHRLTGIDLGFISKKYDLKVSSGFPQSPFSISTMGKAAMYI